MKERKERLDNLLLKSGLAGSIQEAQALVMAGEVWLNGQREIKSFKKFCPGSRIEIKKRHAFASRGGQKIDKAFTDFGISLCGLKVVDIGISTGGFSDYLLKNGAGRIQGIDVNINQVDARLRADPRVRLLKKNARFLIKEDFDFEPDLITIDVSFISVLKILPRLAIFPKATFLVLIKPQFESEKDQVPKRGILRDEFKIQQVLAAVSKKIEAIGFSIVKVTEAGIKGRRGNQEYFFLLTYGIQPLGNDKMD